VTATPTPAPPASSVGGLVSKVAEPVCASDAGSWCQRFYRWTDNDFLARSADAIVGKGFAIAVIVVLALVARYLLHRSIYRLVEGATSRRVSRLISRRTRPQLGETATAAVSPRRAQRARTIGSVLRSGGSAVVGVVAVGMVLAEFGVSLGPILASAGIVGLAVGFGAQNLVRDFLSGMFMLLEDQYGVGDIVDLGSASGTVESVGLRITTVRDGNGTVWYVRNGEILRVGNKSQGYAQVVIDMPVTHDTDLERCRTVMQEVADEMHADAEWSDVLLAAPESLGAEDVTAQGVVMRVQVRTTSAAQWRAGRELRMRLTERFVAEGIRTPSPLLAAAGQGPR
jgi:small-conductance mechanosensitive channel